MIFYRFEDSDEIREAEIELGYDKLEDILSSHIFGSAEPSCSFIFKQMEKSNENDVYVLERVFGSRHIKKVEPPTQTSKRRKRWVSPKRRWRSRSPVSNIK